MMHPVGPLSRQTYWVRRVVVIVAAVLLVIGLLWWALGQGSGPQETSAAADTTSSVPVLTGALSPDSSNRLVPQSSDSNQVAGASSAETGTSASAATQASTAALGSDTAPGSNTASPSSTASGSASDSADADTADTAPTSMTSSPQAAKTSAPTSADLTVESPAATTSVTVTVTKSVTVTPQEVTTTTAPPKPSYDAAGNLICADSDIQLVASARSKSYPVGAQPVLQLTVKNVGSKSCVRDVSGSLQVFTVYTSGGDRVWSTDDCFPGEGHEVHRFAPGETRQYPVTWSGTTSEPGCSAPRVRVPVGKYALVASLGSLDSAKASFSFK